MTIPDHSTVWSQLQRPRLLVTDYDGTLSEYDFYDRATRLIDPVIVERYWKQYVAGEITHVAALSSIFAALPADPESVRELALECGVPLELAKQIGRLEAAGWDVLIVSAGCEWYIEEVLSVRGVAIPVLSNPGHWGGPGAAVSGLTMGTRTNSPFFSPQDGIDKAGVVASAVASGRVVAFAGDGRPDLNAALCVGPDWRFATGWLAGELTRRGERFTRFSLWPEVVERLVM